MIAQGDAAGHKEEEKNVAAARCCMFVRCLVARTDNEMRYLQFPGGVKERSFAAAADGAADLNNVAVRLDANVGIQRAHHLQLLKREEQNSSAVRSDEVNIDEILENG